MHQHHRHPAFRRQRRHIRVRTQSPYIVDNVSAGIKRPFRDLCPIGIDRNGRIRQRITNGSNNRNHAVRLAFSAHGFCAGPRAFTTDVENIRTV